jgi:hypothetical protein
MALALRIAPNAPGSRQARPGGESWCSRKRIAAALFALVLLSAQSRGPAIVTASQIWLTPDTDMPLAISVESAGPIPTQAMLLVRGLSPSVHLSEGRMFGPGVWVVPLPALPRLRVRGSAELHRSDLSLALVSLDGKVLAEAKTVLLVVPPAPKDQSVAAFSLPRLTPAERDAAMKLVERGDESVQGGNVSVARQFYQRAADRGLAEGALALGATYDPTELARMNAIGVQPDLELARKWYERARELGAHDADIRIGRLH